MSVVNPNNMGFGWRRDEGLLVPFVDGRRIANLDLRGLKIEDWRSDRLAAAL